MLQLDMAGVMQSATDADAVAAVTEAAVSERRDLGVPILLVAVTYDAKTKRHACRILEEGC